ncbi:MAG: histidine phosphatase family protein [Cytophagaceae bacterium]|nr:histidine phosphatase family protein [Cytophagaceae bacterium]
MLKNLFLARHAKSDWSVPGQKDFDRELNGRGRNDAPRMGKKLSEMDVKPDLIMSSPAARAKLTAEFIAEQLRYDTEKIIFNEDIYEASVRSLLAIINELSDDYNKVMLVGHNPTFTYIAEYLTKKNIDNIPTCGIVNIEFNVDSWKEVSGDIGNLKWFIYPKKILV